MYDYGKAPPLVPLREAASRLSIAVSTLRRWLRQGRLSYVRCGRAIRLESSEVERFIEDNRQTGRK